MLEYVPFMNTTKHSKIKIIFIADVVPPIFLESASRTILNKNTVMFNCDVKGLPQPKVEWFRDNEKLSLLNFSSSTELDNDNQR